MPVCRSIDIPRVLTSEQARAASSAIERAEALLDLARGESIMARALGALAGTDPSVEVGFDLTEIGEDGEFAARVGLWMGDECLDDPASQKIALDIQRAVAPAGIGRKLGQDLSTVLVPASDFARWFARLALPKGEDEAWLAEREAVEIESVAKVPGRSKEPRRV